MPSPSTESQPDTPIDVTATTTRSTLTHSIWTELSRRDALVLDALEPVGVRFRVESVHVSVAYDSDHPGTPLLRLTAVGARLTANGTPRRAHPMRSRNDYPQIPLRAGTVLSPDRQIPAWMLALVEQHFPDQAPRLDTSGDTAPDHRVESGSTDRTVEIETTVHTDLIDNRDRPFRPTRLRADLGVVHHYRNGHRHADSSAPFLRFEGPLRLPDGTLSLTDEGFYTVDPHTQPSRDPRFRHEVPAWAQAVLATRMPELFPHGPTPEAGTYRVIGREIRTDTIALSPVLPAEPVLSPDLVEGLSAAAQGNRAGAAPGPGATAARPVDSVLPEADAAPSASDSAGLG